MTFRINGTSGATLAQWLIAEPFTLVMSSGFFGFYAHTGMLCALEDRGIRPMAVSGSSAGALVSALWASGRSAWSIAESLVTITRDHFWDPGLGMGVLRGQKFAALLNQELVCQRFEDCAVPCSISVFNVKTRATEVIRSGELVPAIRASCALPLLFQPVKMGHHYFSDGGILDRPGLEGVDFDERVFCHHLSSKSPWRRSSSLGLNMPVRRNLAALALDGLPRVSPFHLTKGQDALNSAYKATLDALDFEPASE